MADGLELLQAESQHRGHAIVEQVSADVTSGPPAHMPSGFSQPTPPANYRITLDMYVGTTAGVLDRAATE